MRDGGAQRLVARYGSYELRGLVRRDACVAEYDAVALPSDQSDGGWPVTVKTLKLDGVRDQGIAADFIRDAERWLSLRHLNVRALVDFGQTDDMLYVCSEPFAGRSSAELTPAGFDGSVVRPWSLYVAQIMAEACRAVEVAYSGSGRPNGSLVHGGISPHAILIGNDGVVRLDDFAFARAEARVRSTLSRDVQRTLPYLAPEQLGRSHALTRQVDVWSLGVCMWEMLAGRSLFLGNNDAATLLALTVGAVPRPSESNPSAPPELDAIAQRCIVRNPRERYWSAGAMEADLRAFIAGRGDPIDALELAALVRERAGFDPTLVASQGSPGSARSPTGQRRQATAHNIESVPQRRRYGIAIGFLGTLLVAVTVAGVWLWQRRPSGAVLPSYEASRASLRVAGNHGGAGAATAPGSADPGDSAEAPQMAGAGQVAAADGEPSTREEDATELSAEDGSRSEKQSRPSHPSHSSRSRSRRASEETAPEDDQEVEIVAAGPARAEEERTVTAGASPSPSPSPSAVAPAPVPAPVLAPALPVREAPPGPALPAVGDTAARGAKSSISGVTVEGGVPRAAIQRALERAVPGFRNCYLGASTRLGRSPAESVFVHLVIDESNQAKVTKLGPASLAGMDDCIRQVATRIKSQTPPDVGGVRVTFEIRFAPIR